MIAALSDDPEGLHLAGTRYRTKTRTSAEEIPKFAIHFSILKRPIKSGIRWHTPLEYRKKIDCLLIFITILEILRLYRLFPL